MNKLDKLIYGVCTLGELAGIAILAGIAFKRNNDCYKAEMKLVDTEFKLIVSEIKNVNKDCQIRELEKEISELKSEKQES